VNPATLPWKENSIARVAPRFVSKRLANAHTECVTARALGDIGSKIDMVLPA
jgi:hypothetical protein